MKNLFIIPTDKPSRFTFRKDCKYYRFRKDEFVNNNIYQNQNIYITSDEKFVRDEYVTDGIEVIKATPKLVNAQSLIDRRNWRKIILTTDSSLAPDVYKIDDEFLEWFVENSSCEYIEVIKEYKDGYGNWYKYQDDFTFTVSPLIRHQIIIPKEESNPCKDIVINDKVTIDVPFHEKHIRFENLTPEQAGYLIQVSEFYQMNGVRRSALVPKEELINCPKCRTTDFKNCHSVRCPMRKEELKLNCFDCNKSLQDCTCMEDTINMDNKETLEEAMNENGYHDQTNDTLWREGVLFGVKWQQERMYSEEEVKFIINKLASDCYFMQEPNQDVAKWFEKNKKK
jgi:hypothetical protein